MNYIVFDLEATCWEFPRPNYIQEIIEIGAIKVDEYAEAVDVFSEFVKPIIHPTLSPFCRELTTINQEDVAAAKRFPEVIEKFKSWLGTDNGSEYLLCSWGYFDRNALQNDCEYHGLEDEWLEHHISLKHQYKDLKKLKKTIGLRRAVENEGFDFEGIHHRAYSDALNLAKIFVKYFHDWKH